MRLAFTIIYNGLHHLKHNAFGKNMLKLFDRWVVVDGLALPGGSTAWCRDLHETLGPSSTDGTADFFKFCDSAKVEYIRRFLPWSSKDEMVNVALDALKGFWQAGEPCYLWQIDADEQWTEDGMSEAEMMLDYMAADCGEFYSTYYVGKDLLALGEWGEGKKLPYRRLWRWKGQNFATHEPPELIGGNGKTALLPQRFDHFAYYFPQDVQFKEKYYKGHEGILAKWQALQKETVFPQPISRLISGSWGQTRTEIVKIGTEQVSNE